HEASRMRKATGPRLQDGVSLVPGRDSACALADLHDKEGDIAGAAGSYQLALVLDAGLSDPRSAAVDWLNYGQFLHRRHQPERLAFACFLKAEELLSATPDSGRELSAVREARAESEARLGRAAATVRRNLQETAHEAATLPTTVF